MERMHTRLANAIYGQAPEPPRELILVEIEEDDTTRYAVGNGPVDGPYDYLYYRFEHEARRAYYAMLHLARQGRWAAR